MERNGDVGSGALSTIGLRSTGLKVAMKSRSGRIAAHIRTDPEGARAASNMAIKLTMAIVRRKRGMIRGYDNPLWQKE